VGAPNITNIDELLKQYTILREYRVSGAMEMSHLVLFVSILSLLL
jgi:hypothetical protein